MNAEKRGLGARFSGPLMVFLLMFLPLLLFASVVFGPKTLIPADALFLFEPFRSAAAELGVTIPQNPLLADLILENYVWKRLLLQALHNRELPLWDPYIFAGHPFLANGQHSGLYPLSILFYILPLWRAYGVFTWLQLGLAGVWMYLFARTLGAGRLGSLIAGITYQFSGFMVVSVVHPMIVAGASWLPFILAMVERVVQQRPALGGRPASLPWAVLGALGLGCQMLAGHAENTYFVLLVTGAYILWRVVVGPHSRREGEAVRGGRGRKGRLRPLLWLALMLALGLALGAVQFIPLYEVASLGFRGAQAAPTLQQVLGWAYPPRRLIAFLIPNFFGNPAHHAYFDLFGWRTVPFTVNAQGQPILSPDWDVKNYVEGGAYLGLLPLLLATLAVLHFTFHVFFHVFRKRCPASPPLPLAPCFFFLLLALFSLACIFGTPVYALVYALPYLHQSHSPFRWVFPLTLSVAVLAAFGTDILQREPRERTSSAPTEGSPPERVSGGSPPRTPPAAKESVGKGRKGRRSVQERPGRAIANRRPGPLRLLLLDASPSAVTVLAALAFWGGVFTLVGLAASRIFFARIEPPVEGVFWSLALAPSGFPDHRAFYSYEFRWIALFGLLLTATGIVLRASRCPIYLPFVVSPAAKRSGVPVWPILAVLVLVVDLVAFGAGFNPAVDPKLLDYTPPVVEFLRQDTSLWRYATFTPPGTTKTMNANSGMLYDLQTIAGYDSIFPAQYANYMALIEPQDELLYNRIASLRTWSALDSPLLDMLNVKYILTEVEIPNPAKYRLVYQDRAVRVYENLGALPRAFTLPARAALSAEDVAEALRTYDVHHYVVLDATCGPAAPSPQPADPVPQTVTRYTLNEVWVDVSVPEPAWLVLGDSHFPGWRAFIRPRGAGEDAERETTVCRANGNFRAVLVEAGEWTVRFQYSPNSVQIGAFITFIAGMVLLFLVGLYLWRFFYRETDEADTVRRVAKNSLAPIVLNLFNRLIEMAFAALMARILGPVGNGQYATAVNIYLWFDIIANFGLDMYLMREVARQRERIWELFWTTSMLRLLLFLGAFPLLGGFLAGWQSLEAPLARETVWATVLLYLGLLPGSLAYGLAALFRGHEQHEYPAAVQTVTTIIKVTLGVLVLVGGLGIVGLAGASIVTNICTLGVLAVLAYRLLGRAPVRPTLQAPLWRAMLAESWPLMLSLLLQALFPGVNVLLLQRLQGDAAVGWYDAARKWMDALNIIPSFFTIAVFPVVARLAVEDREALRAAYRIAVKLLLAVAFPTAILVTLLATPLVGLLSGSAFLPHGAVALRLMVWSVLFGWFNSLTNYVLIALNRQRYVFLASGARVAFTVAANLLLTGRYSYVASAWILIAGEALLAVLFGMDLARQVGAIGWRETLGRLMLAGLGTAALAAAVALYNPLAALAATLVVYPLLVIGLGAFTSAEREMLGSLLPGPLQRLRVVRVAPGN
jgi:O-antigen/teichoic acid export membrane protein